MAGRPIYEEEIWYQDVCDTMVREGLNFSQACIALGIKFVSAKDELKHLRRKGFQRRYWQTRNAFYNNIGNDPSITKEMAIGIGMNSLKELEEKGDHDKVATLLKTISDIAGWTKDSTQISVIGSMSQAELEAIKQKARDLALASKVVTDPKKAN